VAAEGVELAELELGVDTVDADAEADAEVAEEGGGEGTVTFSPQACANSSKPSAIAGLNVWTQFAQVVSGPAPTPR